MEKAENREKERIKEETKKVVCHLCETCVTVLLMTDWYDR